MPRARRKMPKSWRPSSLAYGREPDTRLLPLLLFKLLSDSDDEVNDRGDAYRDPDDKVDAFKGDRSDGAEGADPDGAVLQENGECFFHAVEGVG